MMNIKKLFFYSPNTSLRLLYFLLFFSSLPSFLSISPLASKLGLTNFINVYLSSLLIRETIILFLGIQLFLYAIKYIRNFKISYKLIIFLLPFTSFLYYLNNNPDIIILITGIRFFILVSLPILITNIRIKNQIKFDPKVNDFIVIFYILINSISFFSVYGNDLKSFRGYATIFGPRFSFIFENPIVASMSLGVILLYLNFRIFTTKLLKEKLIFSTLTLIVLYFCFLTGGRAGLSVGFLISIISLIRVFNSSFKVILQNKSNFSKRVMLFSIILFFSFSTLMLSSLSQFSGRYLTADYIKEKGLIEGLYGGRGEILLEILNQENKSQLFFGKPGYGTNLGASFFNETNNVTITDSYFSSSISSFGISGILIFFTTFFIFFNNSFSPLVAIVFLVYSLAQSLPELIYPWVQLIIILAFSNDINRRDKLD